MTPLELITVIILVLSLLRMATILLRKITILVKLPEIPEESQKTLVLKIKNGVKTLPGVRGFDYELYLQKILSKIRVLTLKTENKTGGWLEKLRQRTIQKNNHNNDNYWSELKKAKKGK